MSAIDTFPVRRELAYRSTNGIDVFLLWCPGDDSLAVVVIDENADSFELVVEFDRRRSTSSTHPYAYAAYRGLGLAGAPLEATA